ncbi:MAG: carbamate kinase [Dehalococcoidia bacterium]
MRVVVALGGNALLRPGEPLTEETQRRNVKVAAKAVHTLTRDHEVIVTHGNGPQVGLLALEAEAYQDVPPYGLDILVAETQGMIGYMLEQALRNEMPGRPLATLLTSVLVDPADPAFEKPAKPVGPTYPQDVARRLAAERGWQVAPTAGGFRRVVASPEPMALLEIDAVRVLVDAGVLVICAGGGGVPVVETADGRLEGVSAVVDKDLSSARLAESILADRLLLLTDVPCVYEAWGTPDAWPLSRVSVSDLRTKSFAAGSMGPKVEAACQFVERTGGEAVIGALDDAMDLLRGLAGTTVH